MRHNGIYMITYQFILLSLFSLSAVISMVSYHFYHVSHLSRCPSLSYHRQSIIFRLLIASSLSLSLSTKSSYTLNWLVFLFFNHEYMTVTSSTSMMPMLRINLPQVSSHLMFEAALFHPFIHPSRSKGICLVSLLSILFSFSSLPTSLKWLSN